MDKHKVSLNYFIQKMGYLQNEDVLGIMFYGSYLTGTNSANSDIDLHIIMNNNNPEKLIRGSDLVNGIRIEYFEKPIADIYDSVENDFNNQNNALLSMFGYGYIIYDRFGDIVKLQQYIIEKFNQPLPPLSKEEAKEMVSILNNRMEKVVAFYETNNPAFIHFYHLTVEKIRKFYHKLIGAPEIQTSKVVRVYLDHVYRETICKGIIPEQEFIDKYLSAIYDIESNHSKINKIKELFECSKRDVKFDEKKHRILIKSRNQNPRK
jgi:predicted nucleotidyltransferase/CRISPR/Cas system CSM-associated protein Csm2 small subunit